MKKLLIYFMIHISLDLLKYQDRKLHIFKNLYIDVANHIFD